MGLPACYGRATVPPRITDPCRPALAPSKRPLQHLAPHPLVSKTKHECGHMMPTVMCQGLNPINQTISRIGPEPFSPR
ncbi:unnamed protein product [Fusarium graminearum]|nr:unnamed protein product [Fusarium graminearum]CAG1979089.1 unnamed protein product [Fusarium graminearum]VTO91297.1 unnamed protein product [Fusarium graminearum]